MSIKSFIDYLELEKKYSPNTIKAYENDIMSPFYSCGITINELEAKTVDKYWNWKGKKFVDRVKENKES